MPAKIKITKRVVDSIETDGTDRFHWDRELPGFGIRVRASGRKFFVAQFRAAGRVRRMTLGPATAMTPEIARTRAMALLAEARAGGDPAMQRDADRKAATVKLLGQRFLEEYVPDHCKESTANEYRRSVELFIDPGIGNRKVTDLQRKDIAELHHAMRRTPYQANRTLGVLSKMFNMAEVWGLRPDGSNPCLHVKRFKEEKRERFLSAEEFRRLGTVLDEILEDGSETPLGSRRHPAADADRMPALGSPEAALGAGRPGHWRAEPARHEDRRPGGTAGAIGCAAAGRPAPRQRQPLGDRRPQVRLPPDRPAAPMAPHQGPGRTARRAHS